ncbi:MAG: T9SS type A sorting domain-containing protein [Dysgonamonadaceae bacterium]|nr:T9SS type A sorting domain-containing protein [Dysgonamonadaceae bacterium]
MTEHQLGLISTPQRAAAVGKDIVLYPNPVGESFRINVSKEFREFSVCIIDAGGRAVLQQTVQGEESVFVGHLPQGIYLVRVNGKIFKVIRK